MFKKVLKEIYKLIISEEQLDEELDKVFQDAFQQHQKKVHPVRKARLLMKGKNKVNPYGGEKPSMKRSKSAPLVSADNPGGDLGTYAP